MTILTRITETANVETVEHDFGVTDRLGRKIGATIRFSENTFTQTPDQSWGYGRAPGRYFSFYPCATRNGVRYGASQNERHFDTATARDAAAAKYLTDARKRALK
jgi:hypothetical protein